jgi:predicted small secreted protein
MNYLSKCKSLLLVCVVLQACSTADKAGTDKVDEKKVTSTTFDQTKKKGIVLIDDNGKLGDLFKSGGDEIGSVNKYLWQASIEVLNFLPINSADPFSGIIVFGKGKAPGSAQSYDATVYISDPALDARSLNVTVRSSSGTISSAAKREIESAILSRARQLRLKELDL